MGDWAGTAPTCRRTQALPAGGFPDKHCMLGRPLGAQVPSAAGEGPTPHEHPPQQAAPCPEDSTPAAACTAVTPSVPAGASPCGSRSACRSPTWSHDGLHLGPAVSQGQAPRCSRELVQLAHPVATRVPVWRCWSLAAPLHDVAPAPLVAAGPRPALWLHACTSCSGGSPHGHHRPQLWGLPHLPASRHMRAELWVAGPHLRHLVLHPAVLPVLGTLQYLGKVLGGGVGLAAPAQQTGTPRLGLWGVGAAPPQPPPQPQNGCEGPCRSTRQAGAAKLLLCWQAAEPHTAAGRQVLPGCSVADPRLHPMWASLDPLQRGGHRQLHVTANHSARQLHRLCLSSLASQVISQHVQARHDLQTLPAQDGRAAASRQLREGPSSLGSQTCALSCSWRGHTRLPDLQSSVLPCLRLRNTVCCRSPGRMQSPWEGHRGAHMQLPPHRRGGPRADPPVHGGGCPLQHEFMPDNHPLLEGLLDPGSLWAEGRWRGFRLRSRPQPLQLLQPWTAAWARPHEGTVFQQSTTVQQHTSAGWAAEAPRCSMPSCTAEHADGASHLSALPGTLATPGTGRVSCTQSCTAGSRWHAG